MSSITEDDANDANGGHAAIHWITDYLISSYNATLYSAPTITPKVVGIVGLCLTSSLWVLASWRLFYHHLARCRYCLRLRPDDFTTKRLQHGLLWTTMVVEILAYANMVKVNSMNKINYTILNIVGMGILETVTFIVGTIHWINIISRGRVEDKNLAFTIYPILALVGVGLTVSSTYEAVELWKGGFGTIDEFWAGSQIYKITLLVQSIGWGVHSFVVIFCGVILYRRIVSLPTISQVRIEAQRRIITKMIVPMVLCALSYGLRSGFLAADLVIRIRSPDVSFEAGIGWWVGNCWLPMFIPSMMLLYSFRKRDNEAAFVNGGSNPLLRKSGEEGMINDPFISFHQTYRDIED